MATIGILFPGEMGAAIGAGLTSESVQVVWPSAGRSEETARRAGDGGLVALKTLEDVCAAAGTLISVCPPDAALIVASAVAVIGFKGRYIDANAISPATADVICALVEGTGASYVDGGIIGPPPVEAGTTRLYLSGADASAAAELFADHPVTAVVLSDTAGDASALKLAYASWTKGSSALLLATRALARNLGVEAALLEEWRASQPTLLPACERAERSAATKGWRWVGEMDEIASTFAAAGLPPGFHEAAADIYDRAGRGAEPAEILDRIARTPDSRTTHERQ